MDILSGEHVSFIEEEKHPPDADTVGDDGLSSHCSSTVETKENRTVIDPEDSDLVVLAVLYDIVSGRSNQALSRIPELHTLGVPKLVCHILKAIAENKEDETGFIQDEELSEFQLPSVVVEALQLLYGEEDETKRIARFMKNCGEQWIELCPASTLSVAERWIKKLYQAKDFKKIEHFIRELESMNQFQAAELGAYYGLLDVLDLAGNGKWQDAKQALAKVGPNLVD